MAKRRRSRRKGGRSKKGGAKKCPADWKRAQMAGKSYGLHGKRVRAFKRGKVYRVFVRKCS